MGASEAALHKAFKSQAETLVLNKIHSISLKTAGSALPLRGILLRLGVQAESSGEQNVREQTYLLLKPHIYS